MSKTDKDKPYDVRAREGGIERHRHRDWDGRPQECDLHSPDRNQRTWANNCQYVLGNEHPWWTGEGPPKWFVDETWNGPSRRRSREECRDALREYNSYGETDGYINTDQHRHRAAWHWW